MAKRIYCQSVDRLTGGQKNRIYKHVISFSEIVKNVQMIYKEKNNS